MTYNMCDHGFIRKIRKIRDEISRELYGCRESKVNTTKHLDSRTRISNRLTIKEKE